MNKVSMPIGGFPFKVKSNAPVIDYQKTMAIGRKFRQENNEMRNRQIQDLIQQGHEIKELRKTLTRKQFEEWLEAEGVLPNISGSIETTIEKLIAFFMKEFRKGKVLLNNTMRFTYSYFQGFYNGEQDLTINRVCSNTLKNHFRNISRAYKSLFDNKYRGVLSLPDRSCNCIVLTLAPNFIQYKDPNHTASLSCAEPPLPKERKPKNVRFMEDLSTKLSTLTELSAHQKNRNSGVQDLSTVFSSFFGNR